MDKSQRAWITECPRDAMQGIQDFIPTSLKISYLNSLLEVGFDRLDFGSFVSSKAIPQLRDTGEVLEGLNESSQTELLAIIANVRGAEMASNYQRIKWLGYPFSVSETFQKRNTNSSIAESFDTVLQIRDLANKSGKELLVYLSMAFGNPYNDPWNSDIVSGWVERLQSAGIREIALADTVGIAEPEEITTLMSSIITGFPGMAVGAHLHCHPNNWKAKVEAAFKVGCRRFDSAIKGYGGCPMAKDELVGNLATENLIQYLTDNNVETRIRSEQFKVALEASTEVFLEHH